MASELGLDLMGGRAVRALGPLCARGLPAVPDSPDARGRGVPAVGAGNPMLAGGERGAHRRVRDAMQGETGRERSGRRGPPRRRRRGPAGWRRTRRRRDGGARPASGEEAGDDGGGDGASAEEAGGQSDAPHCGRGMGWAWPAWHRGEIGIHDAAGWAATARSRTAPHAFSKGELREIFRGGVLMDDYGADSRARRWRLLRLTSAEEVVPRGKTGGMGLRPHGMSGAARIKLPRLDPWGLYLLAGA